MKKSNLLANILKSLILPAIVYLIFAIPSGFRFGNAESMFAIARQVVVPAIIAWAICNNQVMNVWDFTPGSVIMLSCIVGGNLSDQLGLGAWGMFAIIIITSVICCLVTCTVFVYAKIPSMITGLGMLMIYESLSAVIFDGGGVIIDREWTFFGKSPWIFIILAISFVIIYILNNYTKFGYDVRSLGNGTTIAMNIGVNLVSTRYKSFLLEGVLLGVASVVNIGINGSVKPITGMASTTTAFSAIMAVMVGMYLSKYCNLLIGTLLGALTLKMLTSGMLAIGLKSEAQQIGNGLFLIIFLAFSHNQNKIFEARARNQKRKEIIEKG